MQDDQHIMPFLLGFSWLLLRHLERISCSSVRSVACVAQWLEGESKQRENQAT